MRLSMNGDHSDIELGTHYSGGHEVPFGISPLDRRFPIHVIGKTGFGKSTFLRNIIAQDIAAGRGFAYFDFHGDDADAIMDLIPEDRIEDISTPRTGSTHSASISSPGSGLRAVTSWRRA